MTLRLFASSAPVTNASAIPFLPASLSFGSIPMPLSDGYVENAESPLLLHEDVAELALACTEVLQKMVQHYEGADPWQIGSLPACASLTDTLENLVRARVTDSQLTPAQVKAAKETLKTTGDLRGVARAARQGTQLYWLLRQSDADCEELTSLILRVAQPALMVAQLSTGALIVRDRVQMRNAALAYREVNQARAEAEYEIGGVGAQARYSPTTRRLARAAVWCMAVSGEGMARIAARVAA